MKAEIKEAENELKEYVHAFLESGEEIFEYDEEYDDIMDRLYDVLYDTDSDEPKVITFDVSKAVRKAFGLDDEDEPAEEDEPEIDEELELNYRLANDDEVASFYFQHAPYEDDRRRELISACIRKSDDKRAAQLVDMIIDVQENVECEEWDQWDEQNRITILGLISEYDYNTCDRWDKTDITNRMRELVRKLIYRVLPHFSEETIEDIKRDIYKIDPDQEDTEGYIKELLEDAVVYSTFPKPRGKGGASNINRISREIFECFPRLSRLERMDVVAEIMGRFANVSSILKPVSFDQWMTRMINGLKKGDLIKVYRLNKDIFRTWIVQNEMGEGDIRKLARKLSDGWTEEDREDFRRLVIEATGRDAGVDEADNLS